MLMPLQKDVQWVVYSQRHVCDSSHTAMGCSSVLLISKTTIVCSYAVSDKLHILKSWQATGYQIVKNPLLNTKLTRIKITQLTGHWTKTIMPHPLLWKTWVKECKSSHTRSNLCRCSWSESPSQWRQTIGEVVFPGLRFYVSVQRSPL